MPKFYTVCYGETEVVDGKRKMVPPSREAAAEAAAKICKIIEGSKILIITSGLGPAQECADIMSENMQNPHQFKAKVLACPSSRGGQINEFLSELEKKVKKTDVFIVVTSPDNHEYVETLIQSGLQRAVLGEIEDVEEDVLDEDYFFDDEEFQAAL